LALASRNSCASARNSASEIGMVERLPSRPMSLRDATLLRAAALWTVFVWATRISNILGDSHRGFGFKAVHVVLAIVSIAFALAIWTVASRNRKRAHVDDE